MIKNRYCFLVFGILILGILSWSPWITKNYAENKVVRYFEDSQKQISDGCGFNCPGCGVYESSKILFGYKVLILYDCGFKAGPSPIPPYQSKFFVSFLGTVHILSQGTNLD